MILVPALAVVGRVDEDEAQEDEKERDEKEVEKEYMQSGLGNKGDYGRSSISFLSVSHLLIPSTRKLS